MRRNYTREAYLTLVDKVKSICGQHISLSSDFICGFCGETEEEFEETLDLVRHVQYNTAFIFPYSTREVVLMMHEGIEIRQMPHFEILSFQENHRPPTPSRRCSTRNEKRPRRTIESSVSSRGREIKHKSNWINAAGSC